MALLALDTSGDYCTVAVASATRKSHLSHEVPQKKAQTILFLVDEVLREINLSLSDLKVLGFTAGPGSFTGLRIAASVVQGLAYALNIPVVLFSTLQAIAQSIYEVKKLEGVNVCLDARRDQVYVGDYKLDKVSGIMLALTSDRLEVSANIVVEKSQRISATALIQLTEYYYRRGFVKKASEAIPIYLQNPV